MMINSELIADGKIVVSERAAAASLNLDERYVSVGGQLELEHFIPAVATHWIALWEKGPNVRMKNNGRSVTFGYFSWGAYYTIEVPYSTVERNLFLVVTGTQA